MSSKELMIGSKEFFEVTHIRMKSLIFLSTAFCLLAISGPTLALKPVVEKFKTFKPEIVRGDVDAIRFRDADTPKVTPEELRNSLNLRWQSLQDSISSKANRNEWPEFGTRKTPELLGAVTAKGSSSGHGSKAQDILASRLEGYSKNMMSNAEKGDMVSEIIALKGLEMDDPRVAAFVEGLPKDDFAFASVIAAMSDMDAKALNRLLAKSESAEYRNSVKEFLENLLTNRELMRTEAGANKVFSLAKEALENYDAKALQQLKSLRSDVDSAMAGLTTKEAKVERARSIVGDLKKRKGHIQSQLETQQKALAAARKSGDSEAVVKAQAKVEGASSALSAVTKSINDLETSLTKYSSAGGELNHGSAFDSQLRLAVARQVAGKNIDDGDLVRNTLDSDYLVRKCGGAV